MFQVLVATQDEVEGLFSRQDTVPRNTKYAITRDIYRYHPPSSAQNYSSYYIPHARNSQRLLVADFQEEEKQHEIALEKINQEVLETETQIQAIIEKETGSV